MNQRSRQKGAAKARGRALAKLQDWWSICAFNYLFVFKIQGSRVGEPAPHQTLLAAAVGEEGPVAALTRNGGALPRTFYNGIASVRFSSL